MFCCLGVTSGLLPIVPEFDIMLSSTIPAVRPPAQRFWAVLRNWLVSDFPKLYWRSDLNSLSSFCFKSLTTLSHSCSFRLASQCRAFTSSLRSLISFSKTSLFGLALTTVVGKVVDVTTFWVKFSRTRIVGLRRSPAGEESTCPFLLAGPSRTVLEGDGPAENYFTDKGLSINDVTPIGWGSWILWRQ